MLPLWLPAKEARSVSQESLLILAELHFVFYPQSTRKIFAVLQSEYMQNLPVSLPAYHLVSVSMVSLLDFPFLLAELPAYNCFPVSHATSPTLSTVLPIDSHVSKSKHPYKLKIRHSVIWPLASLRSLPCLSLSKPLFSFSLVIPSTLLSYDYCLCNFFILTIVCLHNSDPYVVWVFLRRSHFKGSFLYLQLLNNTLTVPLPLVSSLPFVLFSSVSSTL